MDIKILILLAITIVIGFLIMYFTNYLPNKNSKTLQELILIIDKDCYHIHHYMTSIILIVFLLVGKFSNNYVLFAIIGLLIGGSLENFLYKDMFKIKNNCHKEVLKKLQ